MKKKVLDILILIIWIILLIFTLLVCFMDVRVHEVTNTSIGLYSLNKLFLLNESSRFNNIIGTISNILLIFCLFIILTRLFLMTYDYFKMRKISKTNINFVAHFLIMIIIWIIFDKIFIINYRPILINGNVEGSYPSTHVMVCTFILLFIAYKFKNVFKNNKIFYIIVIGLIIIQCIARLFLLMHWFTDVIGGLLIGTLLFFTFLRGEYGASNNI